MFIRISEDVFVDPTRVVAIEVQHGDGKVSIVARHGGGAITTLESYWVGYRPNSIDYPDMAERWDVANTKHIDAIRGRAEELATLIMGGAG